jgi:hypothetical protein
VDDGGATTYRIRAEENGCPKYSLKRCDQPAIFPSKLRHSKRVEHLGSRFETDCLDLLANSQGREKDGNETVLSERQAEFRMTGDLKPEKNRFVARKLDPVGVAV